MTRLGKLHFMARSSGAEPIAWSELALSGLLPPLLNHEASVMRCESGSNASRSRESLGVTKIIRRGAQCLPEQPLAPAARSIEVQGEPLGVGVCHARRELAAFLPHWPASPSPTSSSAMPLSTSESEIRAPSSGSGSVQSVEQASSTLKKASPARSA